MNRPAALVAVLLMVLLVAGSTESSATEPADGRIWTQTPEVSPSQTPAALEEAGEPATSANGEPGPVPQWIWGAEADKAYVLRKTFTGNASKAQLSASGDNHVTVFVNGKQVGASDNWQQPIEVNVARYLRPGENEIIAEVRNAGGPAGFVLRLALQDRSGHGPVIVSDSSWQAAESRDAGQWVAAKASHKLGDKPWGDVFANALVGSVPRDVFQLLPGFQVEKLFTVPKEELGSWVCLTTDPQGRLIASDQGDKGLYRITPPPIGSDEPTKVERLDVKITGAQGLLFAFDSLYVSVNGGPGSGLYRVRDTDGDDQFDEVVKLKEFRGAGEHGPHALRLSPDGKSIVVICGNHTKPPFDVAANGEPQTMGGPREAPLQAELPEGASSRLPANWDEDLLLPRQWDANGHARGVLAPGGWIAKTDPDGKTWEIISSGYRNAYDMAFNADGELFAYDADMEWDMGSPWYRPTRVVHATSGSEFGWRSGTGKWPAYYVDSLPPLVETGPGSPVGVEFGYGTKFPAKYQKALYILDWTFGTMYAIHIEPDGSSYKATKEEFVSRTPLPLTDATIGADGALYFAIGGRGTQSELFRVTYVGDESTEPVKANDEKFAELRAVRHEIEALQGPAEQPAEAVHFLWLHLGHRDRHIRYAARVALEQQPIKYWQQRVLQASEPDVLIQGAVALARQGGAAVQPKLLAALDALDFGHLDEREQLDLLRAYQLVFIRLGVPDETSRERLAAKFDALYPATSDWLNRELCAVLVFLQSPQVVAKTLELMQQPSKPPETDLTELLARNQGYGGAIAQMLARRPDEQKIFYAFMLRNVKQGWTLEQRKAYFAFLEEARGWAGGSSFQGFLRNMDREAFENASEAERLAIEASGARQPFTLPELPKPKGPGREWTAGEVVALAGEELKGRDFKNGEKMFAAARCVLCHRFAGDGGATGPDLTQLAGRFNLKDLTESIVEPNKVISDQYRASQVITVDGKVYVGKLVSETDESIILLIDPEDSTKVAEIRKEDIEEMRPSPTSLMPKDLLKPLNENEVRDLLAYLLSRGNPQDAMFRK